MKKGKNQATTDKLYTDDVARFGEENILLKSGDYTDVIQKNVTLSNDYNVTLCVLTCVAIQSIVVSAVSRMLST
jgi:hypothetical protein